jgi:hypothetical protein
MARKNLAKLWRIQAGDLEQADGPPELSVEHLSDTAEVQKT